MNAKWFLRSLLAASIVFAPACKGKDKSSDDSSSSDEKKKKGDGKDERSADDQLATLRADFKKDHEGAKKKYVGQRFTVTGRITMKAGSDVTKDTKDSIRVNETGIAVQGSADILCRSNAATVAKLKKKDRVKITGKVTGTAYDMKGANIEFMPCTIKPL
jgi:hypothetical protein